MKEIIHNNACSSCEIVTSETRPLLYISHPGYADNGVNAAMLHSLNLYLITGSYVTNAK